jgi:HEPN domain-containing protein
MPPTVHHWAEQAQYDLETARAMLTSGRYLYVLFCCQQAVEKLLKALIVKRTGEFPPRVHSLPQLEDLTELQPDASRRAFLAELSAYYIQTRYPEEIKSLTDAVDALTAEQILNRTEELTSWLLLML